MMKACSRHSSLSPFRHAVNRCTNRIQAKNKRLTLQDERECGRPLGVRWRAGKLYILDAYHGLFELDVAKGSAKHLVSSRVFRFDARA